MACSRQPIAASPLGWQMENRFLSGQVLTITHRASWDPGGFPETHIARRASTSPKQTIVCCHKLLGIASNWQSRELHKLMEHSHDCGWAQLASVSLLDLQLLPARASWDPGGLRLLEKGSKVSNWQSTIIVIKFYSKFVRQMDNPPLQLFFFSLGNVKV